MSDFASKILFKLFWWEIRIIFEQNIICYTLWHICIQAREGQLSRPSSPVNKLEELGTELFYRLGRKKSNFLEKSSIALHVRLLYFCLNLITWTINCDEQVQSDRPCENRKIRDYLENLCDFNIIPAPFFIA